MNEGVSNFEDFNAKEGKVGKALTMLDVNVTWRNDEGQIVKIMTMRDFLE